MPAGGVAGAAAASNGNPFLNQRLALQNQIEALKQKIAQLADGRVVGADSAMLAARARLVDLQRGYNSVLQREAQWAQGNDLGAVEQTPDLMEAFAGMMAGLLGSGGSGSRGGSGSSTANLKAAYDKMLAAVQGQYGQMDDAFGQQEARLGQLRSEGESRLAQILSGLQADLGRTRTDVQGAFQAGDRRLTDLGNEFQGLNRAYDAGAARTLGAFGVRPERATPAGSSPLDLIAAQRATLGTQGTQADASFANRSNVYTGLNSDVSTANNQAYEALLLQLQQQRAAAAAKKAADLAQINIQAAQAGL